MSAAALLGCLLAVTAKGTADRPVILDGATDAYASEFVFFATDYGIYTFNRNSETWSRITTASGLPANRALALGLDEGVLWVATDSGLASADVRIGDWQTYDIAGTVRALAFDDRYVWAGGDSGLARFDKFSEQWEHRADAPVLDLLSEKGRLWIAAATGVLCYDPKFDRIDQMPAPPDTYDRTINTPGRIWFAGRARLEAYRKDAASWTEYPALLTSPSSLLPGFSVLGDSVLVAVGGKPLVYDPGSDRWDEVRLTEKLPPVSDAFMLGAEQMFATAAGLFVFNNQENTRQVWTRINGLENDTVVNAYADQRFIYALSAGAVQYFDRQQEIWKHEDFIPAQARKERLAYLDDAGAHLRLVPDTDIRLSGRAYYSQSRTLSGGKPTTTDFKNIGLNLAAKHKTGRSGALYYDDSDPDQVAYGLSYRGIANDLLNRANAGKLRTEYSEFDIIPEFATLGANSRLVLPQPLAPNPQSLSLDLQAGRIESALQSDFFSGRSVEKELKRLDINYAHNIFYRIPSPQPLVPSPYAWDTVFVDDRDPSTFGPETRAGFTVGGITGDFEPLLHGTDYFVDPQGGVIHFLGALKPNWRIVLLTDAGAQVLQSESVTGNALRNTYFFGPDITPGSFELTITDTAGAKHPLSEFGIDDDRDGRVDPAWLNHDLGFLSFPAPLIPDSASPSVYSLTARYESRTSFYSLTHYPIVKNSEAVLVDGAAMTRGTDYVMDYTSGILLFLKRDVVTDFSQVDVRYSSVAPAPSPSSLAPLLVSAQPAITVAKGVMLAPGFTRVENENIVHISGRAEAGAGTDKNIKFVPQFALSQSPLGTQYSGIGTAHNYLLAANYGIASASAGYQGYSEGFNEFGAGDRRYGPLRQTVDFAAGIEPLKALRLDGTFRRDYQEDLQCELPHWYQPVQYITGKLGYSNPKYPNGFVLLASDRLPDVNKLRAKINAGYEFNLLKSNLKLNGIVQNTALEYSGNRAYLSDTSERSLEYIAEATFSLPFPVRGSVRYRNNGLSSDNRKSRREDELRGQLNIDVVPGLFYTGSYNLQSEASPLETGQDLALESYFYNNLQVAPGRWWSKLSIVNFSVGTGSNFDEYCRNLDSAYVPPLLLLSPLSSLPDSAGISSANDLRTLYGTVQLQPFAGLTLRAKRTIGRSGTAYYRLPDLKPSTEDELKVEYEPARLGMFSALFNQRAASDLPQITRRNLYFEWNMPWNELLRTRLTTTYGFDEEYYSAATTLRPRTLTPNIEALFRFNARSYATAGFGVAREQRNFHTAGSGWVPDPWTTSLRPAAGFNVNLLKFLYLQLNYSSALPLSGTATHTLSARLTTQF